MKKWLLTIITAVLLVTVLAGEAGVMEVSAATQKGTTSDGFSYKISSKDGTVEITGYKGKKKKLVFPEKIKGKKVTKIGSEALRGNKYVTSVDIPDTVKTVEWNSFYECSKLATIKLGKNVSQFGGDYNMDGESPIVSVGEKLKSFQVSSANKVYYAKDGVLFKKEDDGDRVLLICPPAKKGNSYRIPEGTTVVDLLAFEGSKLTYVTFPATVKCIVGFGYEGGRGCISDIKEYKVDAANERYYEKDGVLFEKENEGMFYKGGDELIHYPSGKRDTFYQVPKEAATIGNYAFTGNKYLVKVEIPDTVLRIIEGGFSGCEKLEKAFISGNVGTYAFSGCKKLTEVELNTNVTGIGEDAFAGCSLKKLILPECVEMTEQGAFDCETLRWIEFRNKDCEIDKFSEPSHIGSVNKTVIFGYPGSTAEKYAQDAHQEFRVIGEARPEEDSQGTITKDTIKLSQASYTYDGKEKKPKVTVKDKFGNTVNKSHYKVTYKNNKNVGEATVKVKFNGYIYAGTIQTNFVIIPPKSKITKTASGKNDITLEWKGVKASQISGYEIQYSAGDKFEKDETRQVRVNKRNAIKSQIKNLESKKTYYVRIRSYKNIKREGKTERLYSKWSDKKKVKTL